MKDIIININTKTSVASKDDYYIGTQGQNLQNKLIFEMSEKVEGVAWLEYEIDGNKNYAIMEETNNGYEIDIKSCLLISDSVNVNLRITEDSNPTGIPVFVSTVSNFKVNPSIQATVEEPEQYPSWIDVANAKIIEINDKIDEVDNIDIDVSKSGKVTTVEITKKDGTQKSEDIRDGYDLDYRWNGTRLGVKREDEQEYQETDLQGTQGRQGIQGEPGYTPIKYVDYFTEQEQEEFKDEIVNGANSEFNRNVTEKTTAFNQNASTKTSEFNNNATSKTTTFNENATSKTTNFNTNATNKTTDYNTNASTKLEAYNTNHTNKLSAYNENATTKTSEFDSHVVSKTTEFDNNATSKTTDFNNNATSKTTEFNNNAQSKTDEFNANKEKLQKDFDYYKTTFNAMAHVEDEDTDISLNDTADSPLVLELKTSESTQKSTNGNQLIDFNNPTIIEPNVTYSFDNNTINCNSVDTTYSRVYWNITNIIKNNPGKTIKFDYKNISNLTGTDAIVQLNIIYSDGTPILYKPLLNRNLAKSTYTIPNDTSNISFVTVGIYPNNSSTAISGSVTIEEPLLYFDNNDTYEPYTGGQPSPSPGYPHEVHTVKGDNTIIVSNSNLFNKNGNITLDRRLTGRGQNYATDASGMFISEYIPVQENTIYTKNSPLADAYHRACFYTSADEDAFISYSENNTFTTPTNTKYLRFCGYQTEMDTTQLETGATITSYTEHKEQNFLISLGVRNLLDLSTVQVGYVAYDGTITTSGIANAEGYSNFIKVKPNTKYTFKMFESDWNGFNTNNWFGVGEYTSNEYSNFIKRNTMSTGTQDYYTFTTSSTTNYIVISARGLSSATKVQFAKGDVSSYSPYGQEPIEMCNINNYTDEFFKNVPECEYYDSTLQEGKWYKYGRIGKIVLDGSEDIFRRETFDSNKFRFCIKLSNLIPNNTLSNANLCDYLLNGTLDDTYFNRNTITTEISNTNYYGNICFYRDDFSNLSVNEVKTELSENNMIDYYILATPTKTLLSDTLQTQFSNIEYAMAYKDQTNISQVNEDRPFVISASTVLDLNTLVTRVATLESEV